ncbi:MAG: diguanylate cyclase [Steroidobacteraceae bacterium]|jgi:diguanylate cyclase (GGDEF)-like protein
MNAFLSTQLDFILFFYGLAFIVFGGVCFATPSVPGLRTYSALLGSFAVAHGASEWLDLIALLAGDTPAFAVARTALMAASYLLLLEFARRHAIHFGLHIPGPALHLALILLVGFSGIEDGLVTANVVARYAIGFTAAMATAWVFVRHSAGVSGSARRLLRLVAVGFALYAFASGLVVPAAPLWPARDFNQASFANATGMPIQLVRGLLACWVTAALWILWKRMVAAGVDSQRYTASQIQITKWSLVATATTLISGWALTQYLGDRYQHSVEAESSRDIDLLGSLLDRETIVPEAVANAVARTPAVLGLLTSRGVQDANLARSVLDLAIAASGAQYALVADASRSVVASSGARNGYGPDLPGDASPKAGAQFAFDRATRRLSYQASAPINAADGSVAGEALLIRSLDALQVDLTHFNRTCFLIDADGVVLMTNRPEMLLRPLWPLPVGTRGALARQYGELGSRPILAQEMTDGTWTSGPDQREYVRRRFAARSQWSIVLAIPNSGIFANRFLGIIVTLLMSIMTMIYLYGRERAIRDHVETEIRLHLRGLASGLQKKATTDPLTGVLNRFAFDEMLGREIADAKRHKTPISLLIYDIDHFKTVNDRHGHAVGDSILVEISRLVSTHLRLSDRLARWGGEEFVVLAPGCDRVAASQTAERLRALIFQTTFERVGAVTASFGVAQYAHGDTADALFARADAALYRAKDCGRNRVETA